MIQSIFIILFLITGALFIYWHKKRKFDRSNALGIEQFGSFNQKIKTGLFDRVILFIGYACFLGAIGILLMQESDLAWILILIIPFGLLFKDRKNS